MKIVIDHADDIASRAPLSYNSLFPEIFSIFVSHHRKDAFRKLWRLVCSATEVSFRKRSDIHILYQGRSRVPRSATVISLSVNSWFRWSARLLTIIFFLFIFRKFPMFVAFCNSLLNAAADGIFILGNFSFFVSTFPPCIC